SSGAMARNLSAAHTTPCLRTVSTKPLRSRRPTVRHNRIRIMTLIRAFLGALVFISALPASATVCQNANGAAKDIAYDLSDVFNSSNNKPGQIITLAQKSGLVGVYAICPKG